MLFLKVLRILGKKTRKVQYSFYKNWNALESNIWNLMTHMDFTWKLSKEKKGK